MPAYTDPTRWEGRTLNIAAWGGDYQNAQNEAFFKPFTAATGASIEEKVADIGGLRDQVESEDVIWDVMTVPMEQMVRLARDNVLEPMNYDVVDRSPLFPDIALEYGVGVAYFSATMIYSVDSTSIPQDWSNFWDVPAIVDGVDISPADLRCLRRYPIGTLEFALLADGVPIEELYPLDTDRAFASLDKIRDNVLVWWQESKEPAELVAADAVGVASSWNVRIPQLELTDLVRINWYQGMLSADAWIVPRGAPNQDVAFDFINYATRAIPQANFSILVPYGPVNIDSFRAHSQRSARDFAQRSRKQTLAVRGKLELLGRVRRTPHGRVRSVAPLPRRHPGSLGQLGIATGLQVLSAPLTERRKTSLKPPVEVDRAFRSSGEFDFLPDCRRSWFGGHRAPVDNWRGHRRSRGRCYRRGIWIHIDRWQYR